MSLARNTFVQASLTLASRGYVIETGNIVLTGSSEQLLQNPQVWTSYLGQENDESETSGLPPGPRDQPEQATT